jgi:hypothetical protein
MKAITVKHPWAWAIVNGVKKIENRSRPTIHRGPLLIHAGLSKSDLGQEGDRMPGLPAYDQLVYGAIIGVVDVVDCVTVDKVAGEPFAEGPWCWLLANARSLPTPFPCRGFLGFWTPPVRFVLPSA